MNIYTCNKFTGHYPVGTAAVVEAVSPDQAARILNARLHDIGLAGTVADGDMEIFPANSKENVRILCDGDYLA